MPERNFRTVDCCMNCKNRMKGSTFTHNKIVCVVDNKLRNGRLICSLYERSSALGVVSGERTIIEQNKKARKVSKEEL